ncbi:MAG: tryptophan synthase subunit alpha [Syntrophorhabdaceae bacterium]|nr:tryptophan synthase subunit alpha [Syntrophorhabdaceae bacterium]
MNKNGIVVTFERLKREGKKALIPYLTGGDPCLDKTGELLDFYGKNGASIIEIGVPFSDPMADGPVIQRAMERALKAGTTLGDILGLVRSFKKRYNIPVVIMGYCNPFLAYGLDRFCKEARLAGVDGVLTVDLPPEEGVWFFKELKKNGILPIFLVTPVTGKRRMEIIGRVAEGFLYVVSVTGVTGERQELPRTLEETLIQIKTFFALPVVLGFGVSDVKTIERFSPYVDGFVIGSAFVRRWEEASFTCEKGGIFEEFFRVIKNSFA